MPCEHVRDVAVGDDNLLVDKPTSSDPLVSHIVGDFNTAYRRNHSFKYCPDSRLGKPLLPNLAIRADEFAGDSIVSDDQDRTKLRSNNRFGHPRARQIGVCQQPASAQFCLPEILLENFRQSRSGLLGKFRVPFCKGL